MEEIRYVEMKLKSDRLGRRASLRDYSIDLNTGKCAVDENKKVGKPVGKSDSIRVIYPAQMSEDGKWVRAMNADGTCGYIRASRVDLSQVQFNEKKAETLKAPYQTFLTRNHRILYESEQNIRAYTKDQIAEAKKGVATYNKEIGLAKNLVNDYNNYVDLYNMAHPDAPKPMADPLNGNPQVDGVMEMAKAQKLEGAYSAYTTYQVFLSMQNDQKTLQNQNFLCDIDLKTGRIQTDVSRREARDMVRNLYSMDSNMYLDPKDMPSFYSSCRNATEDFNTFYYGNRFFAEQSAMERMEYGQKANAAVVQEGFGMDGKLTNPFSQIQFEKEVKESSFIANQVKENGGLLICEDHSTTAAKDWISENMAAMKKDGVGVVYIEHLFEGKQQQVVDQFLKSDKNSPMSPALKQFCKADPKRAGFEALFEAARANDMRLVGIGSSLSQSNTSANPHERISTFNARAHEIVLNDLISHTGDPNKGFALLAGGAHMIFHEGIDKNMPLKGLSQMLGTRAIEIENKDGKLIPKPVDTAAVFVPGTAEKEAAAMKIDDYKKTLETKAPEANRNGRQEISVKALENAEKPAPKPESREWIRGITPSGPRPQRQPLSQRGPQK